MKFGDPKNPLLFSARSGARAAEFKMMETVLNIGLTSKTIAGDRLKKPRPPLRLGFLSPFDSDVFGRCDGKSRRHRTGRRHIRQQLERELAAMKVRRNAKLDVDLTADDLAELAEIYKAKVQEVIGKPFPDDAMEQLWGAIGAVFKSWNGKRAVSTAG